MRTALHLLAAAAAADAAKDAAPAAAQLPPRGWSSWNSFKLDINEEVVRGAADVMARELLPFGYEYLLIDDGWPPDTAHAGKGPARLSDGTIPVSAKKFPSGFKNLTDYVHSLGLKIGIYTGVSHWTCGGYTGSLGHEDTDAKSFVDWGFGEGREMTHQMHGCGPSPSRVPARAHMAVPPPHLTMARPSHLPPLLTPLPLPPCRRLFPAAPVQTL
eukprot:SAG22_NODE_3708_length_1564_cov_1.243686_3_plen_215_part_00